MQSFALLRRSIAGLGRRRLALDPRPRTDLRRPELGPEGFYDPRAVPGFVP
ncbi:MAG TPA: hypothetical protein VGK67_30295 [Myxococcales bacterium]